MNTKSQIYSMEYKNGKNCYSIQMLGTLDEAREHAENLGLSDPELVIANIPVLHEAFH